jgi:hypothetical protein
MHVTDRPSQVALTNMASFWDFAPCSLIVFIVLMTEAVNFSEPSVTILTGRTISDGAERERERRWECTASD